MPLISGIGAEGAEEVGAEEVEARRLRQKVRDGQGLPVPAEVVHRSQDMRVGLIRRLGSGGHRGRVSI